MTAATAHAWLRRVSDYHSGAGTPAERTAVEAHLATCRDCQEALAMYRRFYTLAASPLRLGMARSLSDDEPTQPITLAGNAPPTRPISSPSNGPGPRGPRGPRGTVIGAVAAVLVVALLATGFVALFLPRLRQPIAQPTPTITAAPVYTVGPYQTPVVYPRPTLTPLPPLITPQPSFTTLPPIYSGPVPTDPRTVCPANGGAPLSVTQAAPVTFATDAGGQRLPDDLAQKPQTVTTAITQAPELNPTKTMTLGVTFSAPPSGQTSTICGVTVTILAFQSIATPVPNFTVPCADDYYTVPGGFEGTGDCGATPAPHGEGTVSFTTTAVGATATSSVIDPYLGTPPHAAQEPPPFFEVYPYSEATPDTYSIFVQVQQPGAYTFGFSFWQSSAGPTIAGPSASDTLAANQVLHEWGGWQCTSSAMQSQLPPPPPAGQPPLHIICPGPPTYLG